MRGNDPGCAGPINTISGRTRLQPKRRSEAGAVVEAPALLDLPGARGVGHVLLAGGVANAGAGGQRRGLAPDGLGRSGIVHPDPIPEADFTADSEDGKALKHPEERFPIRHVGVLDERGAQTDLFRDKTKSKHSASETDGLITRATPPQGPLHVALFCPFNVHNLVPDSAPSD